MNLDNFTVCKLCEIRNIKGLHARAAAQIVSLSNQFDCKMTVTHKSKKASSISLIKLLTLDAPQGSMIEIRAEGKQAQIAADAIEQLILSGFGE
jgi:phosphotransferase system HPr (HPr) family protein